LQKRSSLFNLNDEKCDWDERDENGLDEENPFSLDRGWTELAEAVRNLVNRR
jgi:hypothetical protein